MIDPNIRAQTHTSLEETGRAQNPSATFLGENVAWDDSHRAGFARGGGNTNGLLRQYLPKGSDLSGFTQKELDEIAWKLNTRPRKSLGFKCPAELFTPDAFDFKQYHAALFALGT